MKGLILAAGRGSRLGNLTSNTPKCLLKIHGKTLLELQMSAFVASSINDISIVTGYQAEKFKDYQLNKYHNANWHCSQMVQSLCCASDLLLSDTCIISYSDIFYDSTAIQLLLLNESDLSITYDPNWLNLWRKRFENPLSDAENFQINKAGYLVDIGGKPNNLEDVMGQYMGLMKITPKAWHLMSKLLTTLTLNELKRIDMTTLLRKVLDHKLLPISAERYEGAWGEVDTPYDLQLYRDQL